jgi:hypothetical protein
VLASHDRGNSFEPSNAGFSARQITSFVTDVRHPSNVYVGVVNDKEWGGIFVSENGGLSWIQESAGLGGRDVFSLGQASDGTILAGTSHGIYRLNGAMWSRADGKPPVSEVAAPAVVTPRKVTQTAGKRPAEVHAAKATATPKAKEGQSADSFDGSVYAIAQAGDRLYAATSEGLLSSGTAGESWKWVPGLDRQELQFVSVAKGTVVAAGLRKMMVSTDSGKSWEEVKLPETLTQVAGVAADDTGAVWVGGREGAFATKDGGATWETPKNIYIRDVNSVFYDAASARVIVTVGATSHMAFAIHVPERSVKFWDTGWNLRFARPVGDHMVAATLFDGIVVQPLMVDSADVAAHRSEQIQDAGR